MSYINIKKEKEKEKKKGKGRTGREQEAQDGNGRTDTMAGRGQGSQQGKERQREKARKKRDTPQRPQAGGTMAGHTNIPASKRNDATGQRRKPTEGREKEKGTSIGAGASHGRNPRNVSAHLQI